MTSKKRALRYIREKNQLRRGFRLAVYSVVANEMLEHKEFINQEFNRLEDRFKKYKLNLSFTNEKGICGSDFFHNTTTLRVEAQIDRY